jgi:molybdopterin-synthase adenylyltransferase
MYANAKAPKLVHAKRCGDVIAHREGGTDPMVTKHSNNAVVGDSERPATAPEIPTIASDDLNDDQLLRYSRHILMTEIGIEGQENIRRSHVLIVGLGGLGSPAAMFLASAGVGHLVLCDADHVDLTNLQRQIAHDTSTIGLLKVESARRRISLINPDVRVSVVPRRVGPDELAHLVADATVVLDCTDNFATRHAINRACVVAKKPLVSGAAVRFEGQLAVFDTRIAHAPCYHCVFGVDEAIEETRCALMGVFAPLVGVIGSMQAVEALKLVARCGESADGKLIVYDALSSEWRTLRVERDRDCAVCLERS